VDNSTCSRSSHDELIATSKEHLKYLQIHPFNVFQMDVCTSRGLSVILLSLGKRYNVFPYSTLVLRNTCISIMNYFYNSYFLLLIGLICYCDICTDTNSSCVTDGYCFTSISLNKDTGVIIHSSR